VCVRLKRQQLVLHYYDTSGATFSRSRLCLVTETSFLVCSHCVRHDFTAVRFSIHVSKAWSGNPGKTRN